MKLSACHRIVVKVGSALLVEQDKGQIRAGWMRGLCADIANLRTQGKEVLVVSSGAIALGRRILGLPEGRLDLDLSQAAAMAGQPALIAAWVACMSTHGVVAGQGLLTKENIEHKDSAENARKALTQLFNLKCVPVINENDAVATEEIVYGDNDRLAAYVARLVGADMLVLLSDIDGLYTANPALDQGARHIAEVRAITPAIEAMAGEAVSETSRGGMRTKVLAARIAMEAGCSMVIARGNVANPIAAIENGARHTVFHADPKPAPPS